MDYKPLKDSLNNLDYRAASIQIEELYLEDPTNFKNNLLFSNCLPEPFNKNYTNDKLEYLYKAFIETEDRFKTEYKLDKIVINHFTYLTNELYKVIKILSQNYSNNKKRLLENNFVEFDSAEQIHMLCIFLEDQQRLIEKQYNRSRYLNGFEQEIARFATGKNEENSLSVSGKLESTIEQTQNLLRYIYYRADNKINLMTYPFSKNVTPYNIGSFEEILHLSNQKLALEGIWSKYKYRGWTHEEKENNNHIFQVFGPTSIEDYSKEHVGINRYSYRNFININDDNFHKSKENKNSIKYLMKISQSFDKNLEALFDIKKNSYERCTLSIKNSLNNLLRSLDDIYRNIDNDGIMME